MEDCNIYELYYSLMYDPGFATQLNGCGSEQEIIELLGQYGIPAEYYEELKEFFYYDLQSGYEDLNGTQVCCAIGFGDEGRTDGSCVGEGSNIETGEEKQGLGSYLCNYVGVGLGATC